MWFYGILIIAIAVWLLAGFPWALLALGAGLVLTRLLQVIFRRIPPVEKAQ
jgi:hypothetical protein